MNSHIIAVIALRILAIYLMVTTTSHLLYDVLNFGYGPNGAFNEGSGLIATIYSVYQLIFAIIIWFGAPMLSRIIISQYGFENENRTPDILQPMLFSVVGVFILAYAIPDVSEVIATHIWFVAQDFVQGHSDLLLKGIPALIKVIIGFALLLGSGKLSEIATKLRRTGHSK